MSKVIQAKLFMKTRIKERKRLPSVVLLRKKSISLHFSCQNTCEFFTSNHFTKFFFRYEQFFLKTLLSTHLKNVVKTSLQDSTCLEFRQKTLSENNRDRSDLTGLEN